MRTSRRVDLSTDMLELTIGIDRKPVLERWNIPSDAAWADLSSPLFAVVADGRRLDGLSPDCCVGDAHVERREKGETYAVIPVTFPEAGLQTEVHFLLYPDTALLEQWLTIQNRSRQPIRIDRIDSFSLHLPPDTYELLSFTSSWGAEFDAQRRPLGGPVVLESRSGRSSNGAVPFFVLGRGNEQLSGAVAWSGNWIVRFEPDETGYYVSGGLSDRQFWADLQPGGTFDAPHVVLTLARGDLDGIARQYHQVGRAYWYPTNRTTRDLPVEWNHWWSYEDRAIDEDSFRANVDVAAELGLELCTLDAGWFGESDAGATWTDYRGDWDRVNAVRFPSGIRSLSDAVHERGLLFGLWCEIEGLGERASLLQSRPELVAMRDGEPLGYVCLGCPEARHWAVATLERLIAGYRCDWIKLDFNLDPGAGCNRIDHGHGPGDGLFAHYRGYYSVLSDLRTRHPEVVLENCSSGGLRNDLGIMRQTHVTFLSDPDWPEHNLQVFWGATLMLAPEVCLQWGLSEWLTPHPHQTFDPHDPTLQPHQVDYRIRTALLGAAGFSLRLPDLPDWIAARIAFHARLYQDSIRRFVRDGVLYRLTGQPRGDGQGERWCAFQFSLPGEHLLLIFRLPGAPRERTMFPQGLRAGVRYQFRMVGDEQERWCRGDDLMTEGLHVDWLNQEDSAIIFLRDEQVDT
jgi:alpha-galactosidase